MNQMLSAIPQNITQGALAFHGAAKLPVDGVQFFNEGLTLLEHGRPKEAAAAFTRVLESSPNFTDAHICLGIAHAMTSRIYGAFEHFERAIQLEPDSFASHLLLAELNFRLRIPQRGYREAEEALRCAVTRQEHKMLARLLQQERRRERNGIARPEFHKPLAATAVFLAAGSMAAAVAAFVAHLR